VAANLIVAVVVAILMSPLFYGAIALLLDVVNLIVPAPNLVPRLADLLDTPFNHPAAMTLWLWIRLAVLAAFPGLLWMALVLRALRRILRFCMTLEPGDLDARAPDLANLAEQRFANVVTEMAIAAAVPAPRVLIVNRSVIDAVAFGVENRGATLAISLGLLSRLERAQMQGVAAQLIASIANGDIRIGMRAALSVSLFALVARLGMLVTRRRHAIRDLAEALRAVTLPTAARSRKFVTELGNPLQETADDDGPPEAPADGLLGRWQKIRPYLWLPLAGPLVITGFFGAIVNLFILGPLLGLAWRQRKYMADATAVRLTRDPDTLGSALESMSGRGESIAPWASHMSVVDQGLRQKGLLRSSAIAMFPSLDRRLNALGAMGAHISRPLHRMPTRALLIIVPLYAIVAVLVAIMLPLLMYMSLALTGLFTGIAFGIAHGLLRWMGHH
jgi:Zn-dependent protease with chaperone function